jgi:hypothetical protein
VYGLRNRVLGIALLAGLVSTIVACREDLNGSAGCPSLCPEQNVESKDTLLDAFVAIDTTVVGYPAIGTETRLLLAARGDTLDARAVMRFDTLTQRFTRGGSDSAIYALDSAVVRLTIDTTGTKATQPVTIEVYDVDTAVVDTAVSVGLQLFRPDRLIGGKTYEVSELKDTLPLVVPLDNEKVLRKLRSDGPRRLRLGFRIQSSASAQIRIVSREGGGAPTVSYNASADTAVKPIVNSEVSLTPTDNSTIKSDLTDYQLVAVSRATPGAGSLLGVGGLPAQRAYLRFDVPTRLVDSATVVRATLILTQVPATSVDATDTLTIYPQVVRAAVGLTDIGRAAGILAPPITEIDSLRVRPADGGQRVIEIVGALREWKAVGSTSLQRAIVLRSATEGASAPAALFYSSEAAPSLRPRLRLTYVNKVQFGVP